MPADAEVTLNIVCDNPACPGNDLDPAVRDGWLFVSAEVYGTATQTFVFCSGTCLGAESEKVATPPAPPGEAEPEAA